LTDSFISDDISGLSAAYKANRPVVIGDVLYVPGTRKRAGEIIPLTDIINDVSIFTPSFRQSSAYLDAFDAFKSSKINRIVGHSLGGAVASALGKDFDVYNVGYGSPVTNAENYADPYDPVGLLVSSKPLVNDSFLHHSDVMRYRLPKH